MKTIEVFIKHDRQGIAHAQYEGNDFSVDWERELADWDNELGGALGLHWQTASDVAHEILQLGPGESRFVQVTDYTGHLV